jgi:dephospho-CoA kinase
MDQIIVGIIGETGSGKSTLSLELSAKLGGLVIEGDKIGHQVLLQKDVIQALTHRYTSMILCKDQINRNILGDIVFNDPNELLFLNQLMHPRIRAIIVEKLLVYTQEPYIFIDGAALIEANVLSLCHIVIYIKVNKEIRLNRLVLGRKIELSKAISMIQSQKSSDYFEHHATLTLEVIQENQQITEDALDYIVRYKESQ